MDNPCAEIAIENERFSVPTLLGATVRVHWHLREKKWSVSYYSHLKRGWRVVRNALGDQILYTKVVLRDVKFTVRESGRQRVLAEHRKNVHAWMEGTLLSASTTETTASVPCGIAVMYSPYKFHAFYHEWPDDDYPTAVEGAEFVAAGTENGVLVPEWAFKWSNVPD